MRSRKEIEAYFLLMNTPPIVNIGELDLVMNVFLNVENPWALNDKSAVLSSFKPELKEKILLKLSNSSQNSLIDTINAIDANIITCYDKNYPPGLRLIKNYPVMLFVKGDESLLVNDNILAIVGGRKASKYSISITETFVLEAISHKYNIITGTAEGVDKTVIQKAIANNYPCISVLASGIDKVSPKSSSIILESLVQAGGCYFTEFPPGVVSYKSNYDIRAKIIASLSTSVIIIQANATSGTLLVANEAINQHKTIYCIPSTYNDKSYAGSHKLIHSSSALLVEKFADIVGN